MRPSAFDPPAIPPAFWERPDVCQALRQRDMSALFRRLRAKLFRSGKPLALSDMLPVFENIGVKVADERPYEVRPRGSRPVWIYDFGLTYSGDQELEADRVRESFKDCFVRAWRGLGAFRADAASRVLAVVLAAHRGVHDERAGGAESLRVRLRELLDHPDRILAAVETIVRSDQGRRQTGFDFRKPSW